MRAGWGGCGGRGVRCGAGREGGEGGRALGFGEAPLGAAAGVVFSARVGVSRQSRDSVILGEWGSCSG